MRLTVVRHVAWKEIVATLRDRRAIVANLLLPLLLLPALMVGIPMVMGGMFDREAQATTEVGVAGPVPGGLVHELEARGLALVTVDEPRRAVERDAVHVALGIGAGFDALIARGEPAAIEVFTKVGNLRGELSASRVQEAIGAFSGTVVAERLGEAGVDPRLLEPVAVEVVDARLEAERSAGVLAWMIPFFIVMWTLAGGQMAAVDATAGEKERGTLESLLVAPVRRLEVVVGKWLATCAFAFASGMMAIGGYLVGTALIRASLAGTLSSGAAPVADLLGGSMNVDLQSMGLLVLASLVVAGLLAALLIGISAFARSFKEAQTYLAPLSFLIVLPIAALQFVDFFDLGLVLHVVPLLNALVLIDASVSGTATLLPTVLALVSSALVTTLLLGFALRTYRRERVIFRT